MPIIRLEGRAQFIAFRNIHVLFNPTSGRLQGKLNTLFPRIIGPLFSTGASVTLTPTARPGHASELARNASDSGADLVVVAGGDGTVNEVVNGMVHSTVPLAVLPLGTANVLATELGIARSPRSVAGGLSEMVVERVSVGLLTSPETAPRYFLMMAGVGLDAHIVNVVDLGLKKQIGKLAYWIGGFGQLGRQFPQFSVKMNGSQFQSGFALASRVRNYGGDLEIAKSACLLHNHFEMVAFEGEDSFRYLKYLTAVLSNSLHKTEGVCIRQVQEVEFAPVTTTDVLVQVDGELAGRLPVKVEIVPNALTLLVPPSFRAKHERCLTNGKNSG